MQRQRSLGIGPRVRSSAIVLVVLGLIAALLVVTDPLGLAPSSVKAADAEWSLGRLAANGSSSVHVAFLPAIRSALGSPRPIIVQFSAAPLSVGAGGAATLRWQILNQVDELLLEPGPVDVTGRDSFVVTPTETTTYILTARNQAGSTSARAEVTVGPPEITDLVALPQTIFSDETAILRWSITGHYDSLTLEPGGEDVTDQTSALVSPSASTTYTLIAANAAGSDSAQVTVTVDPPPEITTFAANPEAINYGEYTMLSWAVSGTVESLVVEPGIGDVSQQTQVSIAPTETTTYTLTASNPSGSNSAEAVVRVSPATELLVFDWNKPVVKSDSGFPGEDPTGQANGNWIGFPNFAEGTYHYRVEIRSQPVPKEMLVQYCVWQKLQLEDEQRESCADRVYVKGDPGAKAAGFEAIEDMWTKNLPIDYAQKRTRHGAVIRNKQGKPVSGKQDWNWSGEIPEEWYPLDWRFTVVVVAKGETFSGWNNYLKP